MTTPERVGKIPKSAFIAAAGKTDSHLSVHHVTTVTDAGGSAQIKPAEGSVSTRRGARSTSHVLLDEYR
ncbi:hypothetical protein SDC9_45883 [bioreactor metagenome]|uniref:Uncharacterized protein n=1 Tax=bioreactor metagenome TaxID=1076179 RepID=A0A644WB81_9ZZZZ